MPRNAVTEVTSSYVNGVKSQALIQTLIRDMPLEMFFLQEPF